MITASILPLRSSITCEVEVGLGFPDLFALGAAMGTPAERMNSLAMLLLGILTATVSSPPVTRSGMSALFLHTKVRGPGQNSFAIAKICLSTSEATP